jgi:DNA-directed RNA polymerase specialized sigma24 family protein
VQARRTKHPGNRSVTPIGQLIVRSKREFALRTSPPIASFFHVGRDTPRGVATTPEREQEVERLYRTEGGRLWRAVMAYCGDREIANDAVAESFAQPLARGEAVHAPVRWLWRSAFRIAAGDLKARARAVPPANDAGYESPEPLVDVLHALEAMLR